MGSHIVPFGSHHCPRATAAVICHFCRSNCTRWNVEADEYHCHDGAASSQTEQPTACAASTGICRDIRAAPECRCTAYDRDDYQYPQSVEAQIAERLGGMWSPYDGMQFSSHGESDIEHVVAISEAHDSGLCAASADVRRRFATDLTKLVRATPQLNRYEKGGQDAAEWLPAQNRCWFAATVVAVRRAYALTIDQREADPLEAVLRGCE